MAHTTDAGNPKRSEISAMISGVNRPPFFRVSSLVALSNAKSFSVDSIGSIGSQPSFSSVIVPALYLSPERPA